MTRSVTAARGPTAPKKTRGRKTPVKDAWVNDHVSRKGGGF
jgi:hypothetical protein